MCSQTLKSSFPKIIRVNKRRRRRLKSLESKIQKIDNTILRIKVRLTDFILVPQEDPYSGLEANLKDKLARYTVTRERLAAKWEESRDKTLSRSHERAQRKVLAQETESSKIENQKDFSTED